MPSALNSRCLALTGTFETSCPPPGCFGCITGDFDGQGLSYSALQWNLGQGTLQPLLLEMNSTHAELMSGIFGDGHEQLTQALAMPRSRQLAWARSIQTPQHTLEPPWTGRFHALGQTAEFQAAAIRCASALFDEAQNLCRKLGFQSQRAAALMFDIKVQNGGIGPNTLTLIESDFAALAPGDRVEASDGGGHRVIVERIAAVGLYFVRAQRGREAGEHGDSRVALEEDAM